MHVVLFAIVLGIGLASNSHKHPEVDTPEEIKAAIVKTWETREPVDYSKMND